MKHVSKCWVLAASWLLMMACGDGPSPVVEEPICELALAELPYATEVVSFNPGANSGHGESEFPGVVLGAPKGGGIDNGSLDVLSLGVGGDIVLGFGNRKIRNGPGPDFVIFENPFAIGGDPATPFAELARVSVSADGETWVSFECDSSSDYPWPGCAGWQLVSEFKGCTTEIQPLLTGGDLFDLDDIGMDEVRFVWIVDLATAGSSPSAGFDLDAVGVFHFGNSL